MPLSAIDPTLLIAIKKDAIAVTKEGEYEAVMSGVVQALRGQPLNFDSGRPLHDVPIRIEGDKLLRLDGSEVDNMTVATALAYADSVGISKMINEDKFVNSDIENDGVMVSVSWAEPTEEDKAIQQQLQLEKIQESGLTDAFMGMVAGLGTATSRPADGEAIGAISQQIIDPITEAKPKQVMKFSSLYENYLIYRADVKKSTNDDSRKQFELFVEVNGDMNVHEIGHVTINDYVDALSYKIPANVRKIFKHESMIEIMGKQQEHKRLNRKMMSVANINKHLSQLSGLFVFAVNRGYMTENYTTGKRKKDPIHDRDKRQTYSDDEIVKIFTKTEPWASNDRTKPELFWINLIGLFSGARLGEICQLRTADVKEVKEKSFSSWVFEVNEEGFEKSVKTRNSVRLIPIHSKLIELGFLDYVEKRRLDGFGQLWNLVPHKEKGWSYIMSKRIAYAHKNKAGVMKAFHSWRHT
ncbi:MAG: site-specific integrase, partial [Mariprofundus sp.]|nr:site-specific integrase [Mariprofundus sp.]